MSPEQLKNNRVDKPISSDIITGMKKPTKEQRRLYASYLGSIKSTKKAKTSRNNGKLGGRPKKVQKV